MIIRSYTNGADICTKSWFIDIHLIVHNVYLNDSMTDNQSLGGIDIMQTDWHIDPTITIIQNTHIPYKRDNAMLL